LSACSSPTADVVFVVDSSASIRSSNFVQVKSFIISVVDAFHIGSDKVRVGLIQFSKKSYVEFDLEEYSYKMDVKAAISAIRYYSKSK